VSRIAWSQLRFRTARTVALLLGMIFAVTSFTVLTAASSTAQLRTTGTVTAHFGSEYQILVRPKGARTELEVKTGTVQPNFLSGIYGGISLAQYHTITGLTGVSVAAPIAMIGYTLENVSVPVQLPASAAAYPGARSLYRVSTTWVSAAGSTRISQPASYVYLTRNSLGLNGSGATFEVTPGGARRVVCLNGFTRTGPFAPSTQTMNWCWSKADGQASGLQKCSRTDREPSRLHGELAVPDADRRGRSGRRGKARRTRPRDDVGPVSR
jgi:putative ABC transport system permease protein